MRPLSRRKPLTSFLDAQHVAALARRQIPAEKLVRDFVQVANGTRIVTAVQLRAMEILLDKVLPDLTHVTLADVRDKPLRELTDAEIEAIIKSAPAPALLLPPVRGAQSQHPKTASTASRP